MQAVAAEFSGGAEKFRCCFLREEFKQFFGENFGGTPNASGIV
jgi:hypothetical protein